MGLCAVRQHVRGRESIYEEREVVILKIEIHGGIGFSLKLLKRRIIHVEGL